MSQRTPHEMISTLSIQIGALLSQIEAMGVEFAPREHYTGDNVCQVGGEGSPDVAHFAEEALFTLRRLTRKLEEGGKEARQHIGCVTALGCGLEQVDNLFNGRKLKLTPPGEWFHESREGIMHSRKKLEAQMRELTMCFEEAGFNTCPNGVHGALMLIFSRLGNEIRTVLDGEDEAKRLKETPREGMTGQEIEAYVRSGGSVVGLSPQARAVADKVLRDVREERDIREALLDICKFASTEDQEPTLKPEEIKARLKRKIWEERKRAEAEGMRKAESPRALLDEIASRLRRGEDSVSNALWGPNPDLSSVLEGLEAMNRRNWEASRGIFTLLSDFDISPKSGVLSEQLKILKSHIEEMRARLRDLSGVEADLRVAMDVIKEGGCTDPKDLLAGRHSVIRQYLFTVARMVGLRNANDSTPINDLYQRIQELVDAEKKADAGKELDPRKLLTQIAGLVGHESDPEDGLFEALENLIDSESKARTDLRASERKRVTMMGDLLAALDIKALLDDEGYQILKDGTRLEDAPLQFSTVLNHVEALRAKKDLLADSLDKAEKVLSEPSPTPADIDPSEG